jgi:hypothetical protein
MMEAARTSETSVDNYFTRLYIPEDKSELIVLTCRIFECYDVYMNFHQNLSVGSVIIRIEVEHI